VIEMAVKIVHAVGDENGGGYGGQAGDQTGREIRVQNWYNRDGGWGVVLECTDSALAARAVDFAIKIAADDSFGYDKTDRATGLQAILSAGGDVSRAEDSEFDCSSLARAVYYLAGLKVANVSTHNMEKVFLATGKFIAHREPEWRESADYAKKGCLYLTAGKHVAIVISDGKFANTESEPAVPVSIVKPPYVLVLGNKVNIRNGSGTQYDDIGDAHKGERYPYLGTDSAGAKWYMIEFEGMTAFISSKKDLTSLVLEDGSENAPTSAYVQITGKVNVRFPAGLSGDIIYTAKNERLPFTGMDKNTGWYGVICPNGNGFVSNELPNNAKLVKE
jgi:uncharacterized protein YgiM (DUF1202 family)